MPDRAPKDFDAERLLDAVAPALGIAIADAHRPGVAAFLKVAAAMADIVFAAPVPPAHMDLAGVFRPGREQAP
ncbi:MAG: hypothetical protein JWL93_546 [Hyphomicrobiales bacterium]|jgi:hypothetical protein|nr:hypothetical protein [Hyphomicrobiales bacterium]